jgi:hypothetical protein
LVVKVLHHHVEAGTTDLRQLCHDLTSALSSAE